MKFVWIALAIGAIVLIARMKKGGEGTQKPDQTDKKTAPTSPVRPQLLTPPVKQSKSAKVAFLENET